MANLEFKHWKVFPLLESSLTTNHNLYFKLRATSANTDYHHNQHMPIQEAGPPIWFHTHTLHAVRSSGVPILHKSNAQNNVPIGLTVLGGGDDR